MIRDLKAKNGRALHNICAAPISKKLPWINIDIAPEELIKDLENGKKPSQRYYLLKYQSWETHQFRPQGTILRQIGEAGNLDAESLRILKMHDICSEEYEPEGRPIDEKILESLRVFTKDIDKSSLEWIIPE